MPLPRALIAHSDQIFIQFATQIAEEFGYQTCVVSDSSRFQRVHQTAKPQLIVYEFLTEGFDGIELTRWLIEQSNTAKVILTARRMIEVAEAAVVLAENAELFPVSVLRCPASRDEFATALKI
jgi:CheY-like chemotaxis protein